MTEGIQQLVATAHALGYSVRFVDRPALAYFRDGREIWGWTHFVTRSILIGGPAEKNAAMLRHELRHAWASSPVMLADDEDVANGIECRGALP